MVKKTFVIEGKLENLEAVIQQLIEQNGGVIVSVKNSKIQWTYIYGRQNLQCETIIRKNSITTEVNNLDGVSYGEGFVVNKFFKLLSEKMAIHKKEILKENKIKNIDSEYKFSDNQKSWSLSPLEKTVLVAVAIILFFVFTFSGDNNNSNPDNDIINNSFSEAENFSNKNKQDIKETIELTRELFNELLLFKDKNDFHHYGFGGAYRYNDWLHRVDELKNSPYAKTILMEYGFALGDLEMLGLEYVESKGKETEYSIWAKNRISSGLNH